MLKVAARKGRSFRSAVFEKADISALGYADARFDKAAAGNVVHLLSSPERALSELMRVTRPGGMVILLTCINKARRSSILAIKFIGLPGADFRRHFDLNSSRQFFERLRVTDAEYTVGDGNLPCTIAVIRKARA